MRSTLTTSTSLTKRQRVGIAAGTDLDIDTLINAGDDYFTLEFLLQNQCTSSLLKAAAIGPVQLKAMGARSPEQLRALGYDTMDLVEPAFCAECVCAYGASSMLSEFLLTADDAVVLAGSAAMRQLGVDVGTLLVFCAANSSAAFEVLRQISPRGTALMGVAPATIQDTGLDAKALVDLGFSAVSVQTQTLASTTQLLDLGF